MLSRNRVHRHRRAIATKPSARAITKTRPSDSPADRGPQEFLFRSPSVIIGSSGYSARGGWGSSTRPSSRALAGVLLSRSSVVVASSTKPTSRCSSARPKHLLASSIPISAPSTSPAAPTTATTFSPWNSCKVRPWTATSRSGPARSIRPNSITDSLSSERPVMRCSTPTSEG